MTTQEELQKELEATLEVLDANKEYYEACTDEKIRQWGIDYYNQERLWLIAYYDTLMRPARVAETKAGK